MIDHNRIPRRRRRERRFELTCRPGGLVARLEVVLGIGDNFVGELESATDADERELLAPQSPRRKVALRRLRRRHRWLPAFDPDIRPGDTVELTIWVRSTAAPAAEETLTWTIVVVDVAQLFL